MDEIVRKARETEAALDALRVAVEALPADHPLRPLLHVNVRRAATLVEDVRKLSNR